MSDDERPSALLIGGRAGVGKTTAGWEVSARLQVAQIAHALVEGDNLDQIFPAPPRTRSAPRSPKRTSPPCGATTPPSDAGG